MAFNAEQKHVLQAFYEKQSNKFDFNPQNLMHSDQWESFINKLESELASKDIIGTISKDELGIFLTLLKDSNESNININGEFYSDELMNLFKKVIKNN